MLPAEKDELLKVRLAHAPEGYRQIVNLPAEHADRVVHVLDAGDLGKKRSQISARNP